MLRILLILWFVVGCTYQVADEDEDDMTKSLIASQTASMVRTAAIGSPAGLPSVGAFSPALQENNLEPGEYTLQFQAFPPADDKGFTAYAIINWKVKGQQITRKVSVFSGCSVSGVAEAVDVSLVDVSGVGTAGFPATALPYKIAVNLSRGVRPNIQQPATLITELPVLTVVGGSTVIFVPPQDAGVSSVLVLAARAVGVPTVATDIVATQTSASGTTLNAWYPIQSNHWVPLAPGATQVLVQNFADPATAAFINVFWGIDG